MQQTDIDSNKEIIFINPFETLGIKKEDCYFLDKIRRAYSDGIATDLYKKLKKLEPTNRKLILSYYMIFNLDKFETFKQNYLHIKTKDCFYYVVIGDLINLKKLYESNKYILEQKDNFYRNLLHYAVIGDYYDICEFLLKEGINYDEPDYFSSTALRYAEGKIEDLLKKYGAKKTAYNTSIFTSINIKITDEDKIWKIYNSLYGKGLVQNIDSITKNSKLIGRRLIRHKEYKDKESFYKKGSNTWINVYHGTKFVSIQHILQFGLRHYGEPLLGHIQKSETIDDIKNWSDAIFVTPSIIYAKNYSEIISSNGDNWYIIIEAKVKPGSFSSHESTIYKYNYINGEPHEIEYRIKVNDNDFMVLVEGDEHDILTTSLLFVKKDFLDDLTNFNDVSIFKYN